MKTRLFLIVFVLIVGFKVHAQILSTAKKQQKGVGYVEYLPEDYHQYPEKKYPVLVFLHGLGERGNGGNSDLNRIINGPGVPKLIKNGHNMCFDIGGEIECFVVIAPQSPSTNSTWKTAHVATIIDHIMDTSTFHIDTNRIYLTGLSLGGEGVWKYAYSDYNSPNKLAAIAAVAGKPSISRACTINERNINVLAYHSQDDPTPSYAHNSTKNMFLNMMSCTTPESTQNLRFISYDGLNHMQSINKAYLPTYSHEDMDMAESINYEQPLNLYEWLMHQSKDSFEFNAPPLIDVESDTAIALPTDSVLLITDASDSDGSIVSYNWKQINGPAAATLSGENTLELLASDLVAGVYEFEISVTDDDNASSTDLVQVMVEQSIPNSQPVVDAGSDVTITLPTNSVLLTSSTPDSDTSLLTYHWKQLSGPSTATLSGESTFELLASDLVVGVYGFEVSVTDIDNASSTDIVQVTVENSVNTNASWLRITREDGTIGGRQIHLYYDFTKRTKLPVKDGGNDRLEFYVKNISSGLDWDFMEVSLRVNDQTRSRRIGDYVSEVTSDWTKVSIPLDDFGHDANRWDVGLSVLSFKVRFVFGYGEIGVDEIKFAGGTSEFVWYGDDYEASGAANAVTQTSDFHITDRPGSGGYTEGASSARMASSNLNDSELNSASDALNSEGPDRAVVIHPGDRVVIYSPTAQVLFDKRYQTETSLRNLISTELNQLNGFTIFNVTSANGDQRQIKYFISK